MATRIEELLAKVTAGTAKVLDRPVPTTNTTADAAADAERVARLALIPGVRR